MVKLNEKSFRGEMGQGTALGGFLLSKCWFARGKAVCCRWTHLLLKFPFVVVIV